MNSESNMDIYSFVGTHTSTWEDPGLHRHDSAEITFVIEGSGIFEHGNGQVRVDAGAVALIPPDIDHRFGAVTAIRFGVLHLTRMPDRLREWFVRMTPAGEPAIVTMSPMDAMQYEAVFRQWLRVHYSMLRYQAATEEAWVEVILLFLLERASPRAESGMLSVKEAADYIRGHLDQPIPVSTLAEMAGMSDDGFRRAFRHAYRLSPKQFQQHCRMMEAKWLLGSTDKSIQDIAVILGFSRLHSFSQWFKLTEGCSPLDWRKKRRINADEDGFV